MRMFTMTENDLKAVMRSGCGMKRAQAMVIGLSWPLKKGWKESVIGMTIDESTYQKLLDTRPKMKRNKAFSIVGIKPGTRFPKIRNSKNIETK